MSELVKSPGGTATLDKIDPFHQKINFTTVTTLVVAIEKF